MKSQHPIKSQRPKWLIQITTIILLAVAVISLSPLTAYAGTTSTEVEATYSDGSYTSSGGKWYSTYAKDSGYKGQGVLIYLLERNGGGPVAGTTPKAFPCSADMLNYELHAQDKYNKYPEVTNWQPTYIQWKDSVPKNGGMMYNSITSNVPKIKAWLKTPTTTVSGKVSTKGIDMVETIWGPDIARRFTNEEIILIAEPIVAVQFSQYFRATGLDLSSYDSIEEMIAQIKRFKSSIERLDDTLMSSDLSELLTQTINRLDNIQWEGAYTSYEKDILKQEVMSELKSFKVSTNIYKPLGDPYAGTSKNVCCKIKIPKVAKQNWRMLHLQIGESCKSFQKLSGTVQRLSGSHQV